MVEPQVKLVQAMQFDILLMWGTSAAVPGFVPYRGDL